MAQLDPNWFYSTLAQSSSGIIGLLGALLAMRLQEQYSDARKSRHEVLEKLISFKKRVRAASYGDSGPNGFFLFLNQRIMELEAALSRGQDEITVTEELFFFGPNQSGPERTMKVNNELLEKYKQMLPFAEKATIEYEALMKLDSVIDVQNWETTICEIEAGLPSECLTEYNPWWRISIKEIKQANEKHRLNTSVKTSAFVSFILSWLCIFGLVMPLCYLTAYEMKSKMFLLAVFALGIISLPLYINYELARIYGMKNVYLAYKKLH